MTLFQIALLTNGLLFLLMWKDKQAAKSGGWRVPENVLLLLTLLGGTPAMLLSRKLFRHKTKKGSFVGRVYLIIVLQIGLLIYWFFNGASLAP